MMEKAAEPVDTATASPLPSTAGAGRTWLTVAVAAFAMVATLPGRTHGLGLVTEPLLRDLRLDRVDYGVINLWATLLGALFCLPWGWLIDRLGARVMLASTLVALGAVVVVMGHVPGTWMVSWSLPVPTWVESSGNWGTSLALDLFLLVLLTRGLGQSALSVVSITMIGRATGRRAGLAIGVYSFITAVGFMLSFWFIKYVMENWEPGWRELWSAIGWVVMASGPAVWLLMRSTALSDREQRVAERPPAANGATTPTSLTLRQALRAPAFWVFGLATSLYGLIASGVSLFNQSLLAERGFDREVFLTITVLTPMVGLASNLTSGWLATRWPLGRILAAAMLILAAALVCFPLVTTLTHVYIYAVAMGIAGGMVTVIFFAVWAQAFGKEHLGQIQGAAQMLTVLASALGPLLLAIAKDRTGSYIPFMTVVAAVSGLFGLAAWCAPMPNRPPALA
jgi:MFS family permease